jgi:hypothetical protein
MFLAQNGFLSPTVDDVLRLVILALAGVNVVVLLAAVRTLRQSTHPARRRAVRPRGAKGNTGAARIRQNEYLGR